jgi:hypothetical protein
MECGRANTDIFGFGFQILTKPQKVGYSVMPAKAGIQNYLSILDSRAGMAAKEDLRLFAKPSNFGFGTAGEIRKRHQD